MIEARNLFLLTILFIITITDFQRQEIDNEPIVLGLVFISMFSLAGLNSVSTQSSIIGFLIGGILFLILSFFGMGGGDVKLMAMIGFFVGWKYTVIVMYLAFILGALLGGLYMLFRGKKMKSKIPFGPAIALATTIVMIWGPQIVWGTDMFWYLR